MTGFLDVGQQLNAGNQTDKNIFIGKVVVNDDPDKLHRIKCEVPELWDKYKQEELPWISPTGLLPGFGTEVHQWIPETGTYVYVKLQSGDSHNPVYLGGAVTKKKSGTVLDENYPHRVGWHMNSFQEQHQGDKRERKHVSKQPVNPAGHSFYVDRSTNEVRYNHPTGTYIQVRPDGFIKVYCVKTVYVHALEDIVMDSERDVKILADRDIDIIADRNIRMHAQNEIEIWGKDHVGVKSRRIDLN